VSGSRRRRGLPIDTDTAQTIELVDLGPRRNATAGTPVESKAVLYADRHTEIGVWEVTPGSFPASKDGECELMQFVSGAGTISDDRGVTEIRPGATMFCPDGWTGRWEVLETTRKTYALHRTKPRIARVPDRLIGAVRRRLRA